MNLSKKVEQLEKSAVKLTVTVAKEDVAENYKQIVSKYAKNAQFPGFRKGHVPVNVLERKYGKALQADVTADIIDKALNELFSKEEEKEIRPLPYAQPQMETMPEFDTSKDMEFTVTYDVFPKVGTVDLKGVSIKETQSSVGDKELEEELKAIQERNATVTDKKDDETAEKDNIATINYSEIGDDGNVVEGSKREGFVFTIGTGENIYKIDDEIIGMKKGETKEITKTYANDDENEDLAGKTKKISVTLTALKIRNLPALDDELAQDVNSKYKTLDDMKADIKKNLELAMERKLNELKSNALLEALVEKNKFDIPVSMVRAEIENRWRMMAQQFQTTTEQLEKMFASSGQSKEDLLKNWEPDCEKMLKSRVIVDALLRERNISVTPEEIEAEYEKIANEGGVTVEEVKQHYSDPRAKEYLIDDAKEQKLYKQLYEEVKITKGDEVSFADLFKR